MPISPLAFWLRLSSMLHYCLTSFNPLPTKETAKVSSLCQVFIPLCFPSKLSISLRSLKGHRHNFSQSQIASILLTVTDSLVFVVVRLSAIISQVESMLCSKMFSFGFGNTICWIWLAGPSHCLDVSSAAWCLKAKVPQDLAFYSLWKKKKNILLYSISSMDLNIHFNLFNS